MGGGADDVEGKAVLRRGVADIVTLTMDISGRGLSVYVEKEYATP